MKIKFDFIQTSDLPISYLSRGHLTLESKSGIYTSKGRTPDQSFKLFFAIAELLDVCSKIKRESQNRTYEFVASDSSFVVSFEKNDETIMIHQGEIGSVDFRVFAKELKRAIEELFQSTRMNSENLGIFEDDFNDAMHDFNEQFNFSNE